MATLPEHLPGEPRRGPPPAPVYALLIVLRTVAIALLGLLLGGLWLPFLLSLLVWGYPPNVPQPGQFGRYLGLAWRREVPAPGLSILARVWITLSIARKLAVTPFWGLAWQLDLLLYGRRLAAQAVVAPLIEISAARSGSTQIARYLEEDPQLVAPTFLQIVFPYRWLWVVARPTLGRLFSPEKVRHKMEQMLPLEFTQRHEGDPYRTDTFDGVLYISHLNNLAPFLGSDILADDFGFASDKPHAQALFEGPFVDLFDGVARKVLLEAAPGKRIFIKGHFLGAAPALAAKYPDARFLTVIRQPGPRLQSAINFLRANPVDDTLGPPAWTWLAAGLRESETRYNAVEMDFFTRPEGPRRCVIRFVDFVNDLEGSMRRAYGELLDQPALPAHVPRAHPPRKRTDYLLNRSLAQLGIDEAALHREQAEYVAWCGE